MQEAAMTCAECKHALAVKADQGVALFCRRYPPVVTSKAGENITVTFPLTDARWCCGEFKRRSKQ
jgi:hypothetical protein